METKFTQSGRGQEPKFCPNCGKKKGENDDDDSEVCDACQTEDILATMRAFGYYDGD